MNVQVIARLDGTPLWFSPATSGRTHDLTAARAHGIHACLTRQIFVLADRELKTWRLLRRARCSTRRIGTIVQPVHTLLACTYSG